MTEKCTLRFCAMSHSAIRVLNVHIFARIQCLFSYRNIFSRKKFHTPTKIHHFVSTPIQISSAPTPVIFNNHSLISSIFNVQLVITYPELCHRNFQWYILDYFNIFFKFEIFITDFHEVCLPLDSCNSVFLSSRFLCSVFDQLFHVIF